MPLTIREAAESAGLSRQALMKAIKTGKVSATKSEIGQWRIEPAELHRVYPKVATQPSTFWLLPSKLRSKTCGKNGTVFWPSWSVRRKQPSCSPIVGAGGNG
jgi:Helix-turn-helix domain